MFSIAYFLSVARLSAFAFYFNLSCLASSASLLKTRPDVVSDSCSYTMKSSNLRLAAFSAATLASSSVDELPLPDSRASLPSSVVVLTTSL